MTDMAYPLPEKLILPVTPYNVGGYKFGQVIRRHWFLWARHLGDDVVADAGTTVCAAGDGEVVWSEMRLGSKEKRNWGGIVVLAHTHHHNAGKFFTIYGHMRDLTVEVGGTVRAGQSLGVIAESDTPENGWWKVPHLHFSIYTGPWRNTILPGYKRPEEFRTWFRWWQDPRKYIEEYNRKMHIE
ncbi:MAG: M23 family metallopeptidase [Saccharofermentanales bacterium]